MKKILFVASEALPFASSGGLGDVIGSLPAAIAAASAGDCDVRVVLPLYGTMEEKYRAELTSFKALPSRSRGGSSTAGFSPASATA